MTIKKFTKEVEKYVKAKAQVGMVLVLGDKKMTCIGTEEDEKYGTNYVFDSGAHFTISNIVQNIVFFATQGKDWDVL